MKKILILSCLFLFGCDEIGVFSHEHSDSHNHSKNKGICVQINQIEGYDETCQDGMNENECLSQDTYISSSGNIFHVWYGTNLTCDMWED